MIPSARPFPADLRVLTALRAFAALLVVMFHFGARAEPGSLMYLPIFDHGQLGVDIFFVLSGFILAHVYLAKVAVGRFSTVDFLVNRLARLYPVHLLMLAVAVLNGWYGLHKGLALEVYGPLLGLDPQTGTGGLWNLVSSLTLTHAWGTSNGHYFNSVSWSISAEAFAYVLFPFMAAASLAFGRMALRRLAVACLLYGACEMTARNLLGVGLNDLSWNYGILRILPEFALGVAFYGCGTTYEVPARHLRWLTPMVLCAVLGLLLYGAPPVVLPPLFGLGIMLLASSERAGLTPRPALMQPIVYLGEISYSTYMLHMILGKFWFNALARFAGYDSHALPTSQILLALIPLLMASALSYHLIEQPGRHLLRAWLRPRPSTAQALAPAP